MTAPDGTTSTPDSDARRKAGAASGTAAISQMGLYRVSDGTRTALAAAGPLNPIEFADVRTTAEKLGPIVAGERRRRVLGRRRRDARTSAGSSPGPQPRPGTAGWGCARNGDYVVTGFSELPLLPGVAALLLAIGLLIAAWRREGR